MLLNLRSIGSCSTLRQAGVIGGDKVLFGVWSIVDDCPTWDEYCGKGKGKHGLALILLSLAKCGDPGGSGNVVVIEEINAGVGGDVEGESLTWICKI